MSVALGYVRSGRTWLVQVPDPASRWGFYVKAPLKNMKKAVTEYPGERFSVRCKTCEELYSADPLDHFMLYDDDVFRCCGQECNLVLHVRVQ